MARIASDDITIDGGEGEEIPIEDLEGDQFPDEQPPEFQTGTRSGSIEAASPGEESPPPAEIGDFQPTGTAPAPPGLDVTEGASTGGGASGGGPPTGRPGTDVRDQQIGAVGMGAIGEELGGDPAGRPGPTGPPTGRRRPTSSEERRARNELVGMSPFIDPGDVLFVDRGGQTFATVDQDTLSLLGGVGFDPGADLVPIRPGASRAETGGAVGETGGGEDLPFALGGASGLGDPGADLRDALGIELEEDTARPVDTGGVGTGGSLAEMLGYPGAGEGEPNELVSGLEEFLEGAAAFTEESGEQFTAAPEGEPTATDRFFQAISFGVARNPNRGGPASEIARRFTGALGELATADVAAGASLGLDLARFNEQVLGSHVKALLSGDPEQVEDVAEADVRLLNLLGGVAVAAPGAAAAAVEEDPFILATAAGKLGGGLVGGLAAGRAIEAAPGLARSVSIRARGGTVFDLEDLSQPPAESGVLPAFTGGAQSDPAGVAVREFLEQARKGGLAEQLGSPVAFTGRAAEAVREFGGFGRGFTAPRGRSEIPGLFFSADLSPLRLPFSGGRSGLPSLRGPRPRLGTSRVAAEVDPDVGVMPSSVTSLEGAAAFMDEFADLGRSFVRSRELITPEQEAIAPPGAPFASTGTIFGVRAGGDVVPGRVFRRAADADDLGDAARGADAGGAAAVDDVLAESGRAFDELDELVSREGSPFFPVPAGAGTPPPLSSAPSAASPGDLLSVLASGAATAPTGVPSGASTTPSGPVDLTTLVDLFPSAPPSGPSGTPTPGPSGAPSVPPSSIPPSAPPTGPPSSPPSGPPGGPSGAPPSGPPVFGPPFGPGGPGSPLRPRIPREEPERRSVDELLFDLPFRNPVQSAEEVAFSQFRFDLGGLGGGVGQPGLVDVERLLGLTGAGDMASAEAVLGTGDAPLEPGASGAEGALDVDALFGLGPDGPDGLPPGL